MPNKIPFESEFILHAFTQKHLKELFGLDFVASEKQLYNYQPDNLAFDKLTSSLVILNIKTNSIPLHLPAYFPLTKMKKRSRLQSGSTER